MSHNQNKRFHARVRVRDFAERLQTDFTLLTIVLISLQFAFVPM